VTHKPAEDEVEVLEHLRAIREHLHRISNQLNANLLKIELIYRWIKDQKP
jgi:hypothetical protein